MKVIDLVKDSFFKYPSLYATSDNFEDIKFAVLHHQLIVLGNGIEWAHTKDPKKAGYLVEPKLVKRHDEWQRAYDLPYGKKKINIDIEPYLKSTRYQLNKIDHKETQIWQKIMKGSGVSKEFIRSMSRSQYEKPSKTLFIESEFHLLPPNTILPGEKYMKTKEYFLSSIKDNFGGFGKRESPYPNFEKKYSCFYEKGVEYIQDDWREESINHLKYWNEWFSDDEKIKTYHNYPKNNKKEDNDFLKMLKRQVAEGKKLEAVCKDYGLKPFDLHDKNSYQDAAMERWKKEEKQTKKFITETITKLKNK